MQSAIDEAQRTRRSKQVESHTRVKEGWDRAYRRLTLYHRVLSIGAVVFSAFAAATPFISLIPGEFYGLLAGLAACATGLLTAQKPGESADRHRMAWAILGNQILLYEDCKVPVEAVMRACQYGEALVRNTSPADLPTFDSPSLTSASSPAGA